MSDTLALLALMKKGEGLTEEQVNQVIDNKNLQPKLTAGENITIDANNVISATDTGLTQEQVNTLIESKNLQPKLTAGTNITIEGNVISSTDTGLNETEVNTLIDNKNLQPMLTAGDNITIVDNVISATASGGGSDLSAYIAGGSENGSLVVSQESKRGVVTATALGSLAVGDTYGRGTVSVQAEGSAVIGYSTRTISNRGDGSLVVGNVQENAIIDNIGSASIVCGWCNSSDADVYNSGVGSLVVGMGVKNTHNTNAVFGRYNADGNYSLVIGNGTSNTARSNALTVDWAGNLVCNNIPAAPTADGNYVLKCSIVSGVPTYSWVAQA